MMKTWNEYWFRPAPYFDLCFVRIIAVITQLKILTSMSEWYVGRAQLDNSYWNPIVVQLFLNLPAGWGLRPSLEFLDVVYYVACVAGVLSLVGLMTNLSLLVFTLSCTYLISFIYSFGDFHHQEAVLVIAMGALALSPSGRVLSIDALLRRPRAAGFTRETSEFAGWPLKLIGWFFVLMYLSAFYSKIVHGGWDWPNGYTLQYYLIRDGMKHGSDLGLWLSQFHVLVLLLQYFTILFQGTFALAMLFPRTRWFFVPVGFCLHLGIQLTLSAGFYAWMAMYAVFVPWTAVFERLLGFARGRTETGTPSARATTVAPLPRA